MTGYPAGVEYAPIEVWPIDLTPSSRRRSSPFSAGWSSTVDLLARELREVGARDRVLRIALLPGQFRRDGLPRAGALVEHPGVIVEFVTGRTGEPVPWSFPCDTFTTWQDNLRAVALTMEALRKVERYGVTRDAQQYHQFRAIKAPHSAGAPMSLVEAQAWLLDFVGGSSDGQTWPALVRRAKRRAHPDAGGSRHDWDRLALAIRALETAGVL